MSMVGNVLRIARAEVGYREGRNKSGFNNVTKYAPAVPGLEWAQAQAWCATFVSWVAITSGCGALYPKTASCDVAMKWFKDRKAFNLYPAIGAQVFYGKPGDSNHTGICIAYTADTITAIEGNTNDSGSREGDGVYVKVRNRHGANVLGYGYPAFPEGILSADPRAAFHSPTGPVKAPQSPAKTVPVPKPPKAPRSRGRWADVALAAARKIEGTGDRAKGRAAAIKALESIPFV